MAMVGIFGLCSLFTQAQTFFVAVSGNDNASGTRKKPLASLNGARDKIRELRRRGNVNDTIFVKIQGGTYYMSEPLVLSEEDTGTAVSPVIFMGDDDERPVFCGGMKIDNFEAVNPNLWRTYVPATASYGFYF